ncbi:MAG: arylesterase [Gammaproteobacteria bacterium]|jgi:acyl-CoA thioesterase-1|nr:arylesterase [Gammaproteobacteria bacterium]MDH3811785.1 arylesterase [Gammaproteobacteria bacterium]
MRKILTLVVLLVVANAQATEPPTILVFGDSLSAGYGIDIDRSWVTLLQQRLEETGYEHRVVNASISGETTAGGATRIDTAIVTFEPELIILELGANDGLRGFPTASIRTNIEIIARRARDSGAEVVLLGIRIPTNYGVRYTQAFEAVFSDVAADLEIRWIEFFMDGIALNDELLQEDRIHPNAEAQPMLLDNAWPIIRATLDAQ